MSRILIRLAVPDDQRRFLSSGLLPGNPPGGGTWDDRLRGWFLEQQRVHRFILIADDGANILGCVHILFKPPEGMNDPEVVNGKDVALMEHLRLRPKMPTKIADQVAQQLEREAENFARKRGATRLTYMLPGESAALLHQARAWGFIEFRVMNDAGRNLIFLRKRLVEFHAEPPPAQPAAAATPAGTAAAPPAPAAAKPPAGPAAKPAAGAAKAPAGPARAPAPAAKPPPKR